MTQNFLLLLDISGSMYGENGEKILGMNQAVESFIEGAKEIIPEPLLAIITFGETIKMQDFYPLSQIAPKTYKAAGKSPLSEAVKLAGNTATKDTITILISDGAFNDSDYIKIPLLGEKYAIGIGADADHEQLSRFTGSTQSVLPPHTAADLPGYALARRR